MRDYIDDFEVSADISIFISSQILEKKKKNTKTKSDDKIRKIKIKI